MDSLSSLTAFVRAADARSFTLAARELSVSPSAIGKAVSRLEERLGVRLFHRSTRSVSLTPEGAMFLERSRRILCEIEAAESEFAEARGAPSGRLRVSLPLLGVMWNPVLTAFMAAYPKVQLDLDFSDRLVDVIEGGFDAVIRAGEVTDSRLMSRVLGQFHLKLVASAAYLARRGTPATPDELVAHDCLHHRFATSGRFERWPLRDWSNEAEAMQRSYAIANTIEPLIHMAEQGLGIACLPESALRRQLAEGTLRLVLEEYTEHAGTLRLLWPASRYPAPKLRGFIDFVSEHLEA